VARFGRRIRQSTEKSRARLADLSQILQETISGNRVVKAFGMEQFEIRKFREARFRLRTFIDHARFRIAGKLCRQALNRISRPLADPPRPLRLCLFQVSQPSLQAQGIQLIDGKHTDTALRAPGTTHQPLAATARSIGQSGVDDLDQG